MPLAELLEEDVQMGISVDDLFTGRENAIKKFLTLLILPLKDMQLKKCLCSACQDK